MKKVKIPVGLARKIEELRNQNFTNSGILHLAFSSVDDRDTFLVNYAHDNPQNFVNAVVDDYEVEQEDMHVTITSTMQASAEIYVRSHSRNKYLIDGALEMLEILGIKMDGVNK